MYFNIHQPSRRVVVLAYRILSYIHCKSFVTTSSAFDHKTNKRFGTERDREACRENGMNRERERGGESMSD